MAEIQQKEGGRKRGGIRSKKLSTRVDLTPMVDLGFLLITFFIFTTTLSEPKAMGLNLPADKKDNGPDTKTAESKTLNLVLASDDRVVYYNGMDENQAAVTTYAPDGLRAVILNKMAEVAKRSGNASETVILIKPTAGSTYKNLVDVMDEMQINQVARFVLMDATSSEIALTAKK